MNKIIHLYGTLELKDLEISNIQWSVFFKWYEDVS